MEALLGFALTIAACAWLALTIWFVVIAIRFLRSGRKAFDRYVELTAHQAVAQPAIWAQDTSDSSHLRASSPPAYPPPPKW
ncbi:MAG TPA: hypothetical protein VGQ92_22435 [Actinoplanes sp.]|jgi:hypothetical protein|nr:hypothetical protein [Actinoplanes sp.]